jgi:hypothetical protein
MPLKEITRRYKKMLGMANYSDPVIPNRTNCYSCKDCEHFTKTIEIDHGIVPFTIPCEKCKGDAINCYYYDLAQDQAPTLEWYRPTIEQTFKRRKDKDWLYHVLMGGLDSRKVV